MPAATLCAIGKGRDPKSPRIRQALGLPAYRLALVRPRPTFEQRAADYDTWKARNLPALLEIVAWAEAR